MKIANLKLVEVVTVADVHAGKRVDDSFMQIWYYQSWTQPSGPLCLWQCFYFNCLHHLLIWWALCNHRLLQGKHPLCAVHPSRLCKARWMHFVTLHGSPQRTCGTLSDQFFWCQILAVFCSSQKTAQPLCSFSIYAIVRFATNSETGIAFECDLPLYSDLVCNLVS